MLQFNIAKCHSMTHSTTLITFNYAINGLTLLSFDNYFENSVNDQGFNFDLMLSSNLHEEQACCKSLKMSMSYLKDLYCSLVRSIL